jgi:pSer/pThr/pTyr-binding forkhead associated (FHA) protein
MIHVVNFNVAEEVKVGRSNDSEIRISDISVSRFHALIKKSPKGYFYIEDKNSKFGTLALIRQPILLNNNESNFI